MSVRLKKPWMCEVTSPEALDRFDCASPWRTATRNWYRHMDASIAIVRPVMASSLVSLMASGAASEMKGNRPFMPILQSGCYDPYAMKHADALPLQ